jgi:predicted aconitase
MRLTEDQRRILDGKEGVIRQEAMLGLVKYGTAMGAEEFVPISSAHTFFMSPRGVAQYFSPRRVRLNGTDVAAFCERLAQIQVKAKTTINPGPVDLEKWTLMGAREQTYRETKQVMEISRRCGIMATWTCTPYLEDNIPILGEHCSWSESSALIYANSILGARTNREGGEASFYSGLLGITPKYGLHLDENRKGTHLIDVQCEMNSLSDWGALGFFAGEVAGADIPVFTNLETPSVEQAKQLGAAINVPGGAGMYHIVGVTPEASTMEAAFGNKKPMAKHVFDRGVKSRVYDRIKEQPAGKVNMVFLGCPHATLQEIIDIARMLEGNRVSKGTRLWVMTAHSIRASAERLGYAQVIEESGGEVFADGCLSVYYVYYGANRPNLERVATNSAKQSLVVRRSFGSKVFFGDTERCIQVAIDGGI